MKAKACATRRSTSTTRTRLLTCVSCNPSGPSTGCSTPRCPAKASACWSTVAATGKASTWPAASRAGRRSAWTRATHQPRYLSNSGRLFFDSPDELVPQASNAKEDVYEYEPARDRQLHRKNRCVSLISSGTAQQESAFLDASENGDRRVLPHRPAARPRRPRHQLRPLRRQGLHQHITLPDKRKILAADLRNHQTCNPGSTPTPTAKPPSTASTGPVPTASQRSHRHRPAQTKPKPLTRAQRLAKALKTCRNSRTDTSGSACEKQARRATRPSRSQEERPAPPNASRAGAVDPAARVRCAHGTAAAVRLRAAVAAVILRLDSISAPTYCCTARKA